jgi:hypothetical protein
VDGEVRERDVEIRPDPRLSTTPAEYRAQFALMIRIRDTVSEIHDAINRIRDVRAQLAARERQLAAHPGWSALRDEAIRITTRLTAIESTLIQPGLTNRSGELDSVHFPVRLNNKLEALGYQVARSDTAPTTQEVALYEDLAQRAREPLAALDGLLTSELSPFNAAIRAANVPAVVTDSAAPS